MSDSHATLLEVIFDAISQDQGRVKNAEMRLKQWEVEPNFFATLQDIFYNESIEHDARFLAGIYLKNGIEKYWRRTSINPIREEEKSQMRVRLLQVISEKSNKLAALNAIIIARIARLEYPVQWPQLLPSLIELLERPFNTISEHDHFRVLQVLFEVLSELSTRALAIGRKQFTEIAPRTFQSVAVVYHAYASQTAQHPNVGQGRQISLDIVVLCVKCFRILMVSGIRDVHKYDETKTFITRSLEHLKKYLGFRIQLGVGVHSSIQTSLEATINEYGSMYTALLKAHPVSVSLCPSWFDIIDFYWQNILQQGDQILQQCISGELHIEEYMQSFLLQGMRLIKDTIKNPAYATESRLSDTLSVTSDEKALSSEARRIALERFLRPEFVNACAETLVSKYMLLTPDDLEKWDNDPEGWANTVDDEEENWEVELRACAEVCFTSLLLHYRKELMPVLLNLFDHVAGVTSWGELLFKDAVYNAIGMGVRMLYGHIDFEAYTAHRLTQEISNKDPQFRILRRRIAWMLGKWANESISAECRTHVYEALLHLMAEEEDLVVRLSSAHSLKSAIDDWEFDISLVLPFLERTTVLLMKLVASVEEAETIMKLMSDLNTIMDRCGSHMAPYTMGITELLAAQWGRAQSQPLFQSALVVSFTKIAAIMNEESARLHAFLLPMLQYCVDIKNDAHVYLLDDALNLWWTLLQSSKVPSPEIMQLLPVSVSLLEYDTENLPKLLWIIDSYLLLNPEETIHSCGPSLFTRLAYYIGGANSEGSSVLSHTIELAIQCLPRQEYEAVLVKTGILDTILAALLQDKLYAYAVMAYMGAFSRIAIQDATFVINFLQTAGQRLYPDATDFFENVLSRWMDKFDSLSHPRTRKLTCMAFTALVKTYHPIVLSKLPQLLAIWSSVGYESKEIQGEEAIIYSTDVTEDLARLGESAEMDRLTLFRGNDPVYTTDAIAMIQQTINDLNTNHSDIFKTVDPILLDQVAKLLS